VAAVFSICLSGFLNAGTVTYWPSASYLHLCASVAKHSNLVPATERLRSEAGKVNVGLASHWLMAR